MSSSMTEGFVKYHHIKEKIHLCPKKRAPLEPITFLGSCKDTTELKLLLQKGCCLLTWGPARLHYATRSLQTSRSGNRSDAGLYKASEEEFPSAYCRPSAVPFHWCSHCTSCTPCLLFLSGRKGRRKRGTER